MNTATLLELACVAKAQTAALTTEEKNQGLAAMAAALEAAVPEILAANAADLARYGETMTPVMRDRLLLNEKRILDMAAGVRAVAALPDPAGAVLETVIRPNGLKIEKTAVPLGVVAIIYESRPNVTADAAALCFKSGNACVLRAGKEAHASAEAITAAMRVGLRQCGLPENAIGLVEDPTRESARELMEAVGKVDLLIPRGGAGLIRACTEGARVPVIQTGTGICHIYVDESADPEQALRIVENAKTSRPSVCNAAEVLLVHRAIAPAFLPRLRERLGEARRAAGKTPVEFRCDPFSLPLLGGVPAGPADFDTEFLDYVLAVRCVENVREAIAHIALHSTGHSEAILTQNQENARLFTRAVDSAAVYVNASTRYTDGGEFGLGCEMGISTQKLHARGPMGLRELTTYKYIVTGNGQCRE